MNRSRWIGFHCSNIWIFSLEKLSRSTFHSTFQTFGVSKVVYGWWVSSKRFGKGKIIRTWTRMKNTSYHTKKNLQGGYRLRILLYKVSDDIQHSNNVNLKPNIHLWTVRAELDFTVQYMDFFLTDSIYLSITGLTNPDGCFIHLNHLVGIVIYYGLWLE